MRSLKGLRIIGNLDATARRARMCIGGSWEDAGPGEWLEVISPATGELVGYVPMAERSDVQRAIAAARASRHRIAGLSIWERAALCHRIAEAIDARREELARLLTLEQGKPYHAEALGEAAAAAQAFRAAAEQMKWLETAYFPVEDGSKRAFSRLRPKGVVSVITPWNFPLSQPSIYYLAPGLMTGNAMVWLPAPTTSFIAEALMAVMIEAGLPEGVINLVYGEGPTAGDELVINPGTEVIAFTGSSETGKLIAQRGAGKFLMLELGGNGPSIVFDDADLSLAARRIAKGAFGNAGQICTATERVLVHHSVREAFVDHLAAEAAKVRLGPSFDHSTTMGPLNNEDVALKMDDHIADALRQNARLVFGGAREKDLPTRLYYQPTVLTDVTPDSLLNSDETFGPILPVLSFGNDEDLFDIVGASRMGLSGAVFTQSTNKAFHYAERLDCGIVNVNEMSSYWEMHMPAGGTAGSASGIGRTGGRHTLLEMSDLQTITITLDSNH